MTSSRGRARRRAWLVAGNLAILLLLVLLLEGLSSVLLFARDVSTAKPLAERLHTRYDRELGWVNLPNVRRPDMYGPGVVLTTNARGFRGSRDVTAEVPPGRTRVVCSGDSFTLGYGVADHDAWCALLEQNGSVEAVNMGQGGYGFDQAYLWYRREAPTLAHDVHIFAFITDDFRRAQHAEFMGSPKPVFKLENDSLVLTNVPVPAPPHGLKRWATHHAEALRSLRMVQTAERALGRRVPSPAAERTVLSREQNRLVVARIIADLARYHRAHGSRLLLVHLPTTYELRGDGPTEWQAFLHQQGRLNGVEYIDLFPHFRRMPDEDRARMFLLPGEVRFPAAAGHLSTAGNLEVAAVLRLLLTTGSVPAPSADAH